MVSPQAAHALQTKENRSAWPAWVFLSRVRVKPERPQKGLDRRRSTTLDIVCFVEKIN